MHLDPPLWRRPAWAVLALIWLSLPLTAGGALAEMVSGAAGVAVAVPWALAALVYGAGLVCLLRSAGAALAALRLTAMGLLIWVGLPSLLHLAPAWGGAMAALCLLVAALAWSTPLAQASAEASAVPGERRFALATAPTLGWVLGPVSAAVAASGIVLPLLLLSIGAARFGAGADLLLVVPGLALAAWLVPAHLRLARRWLVLVPSGVVVHDPVLLHDTYRLSPSEIGAVGLTAPGWRPRLAAPDVLDITGGVGKALWIGLVDPLAAPGTRPGVRRPGGPIRHLFCAPAERAEAAAALAAKGYRLAEPVGPP